MIHIDFVTVNDKTVRGNSHIICAIDRMTRYGFTEAVPDQTSKTAIAFIKNHIADRVCLPKTLISDNGTDFTSTEFQKWVTEHKIEHVTSAPYCPQGNC